MKAKRSYRLFMAGAVLAVLICGVLSLMLGTVDFSLSQVVEALGGRGDRVTENILRYSRISRTLGCLLAGAALAVSGAVLQSVLANDLASPSIIGVNAGAGLGVAVACALGSLSGLAVSTAAFLGSLAAVTLIAVFARASLASRATVILGGVALNSVLGAIREAIGVLDPDVTMLAAEFRVGGFSSVTYARLVPAAVMILGALAVLMTLLNELDVVSLGDDTARGVGLKVGKYRILFLILAALLAGAAVSFAGLLGFVGLIVPHFVRRLVGSESRRLLPAAALVGGAFVCGCDLVARLLFRPYELPVGIVLSVIGGPVFVWMLVRLKGGRRDRAG